MQLLRFGIYSVLGMVALSFASFTLIAWMPADPVQIAIRVWNLAATSETVAALREGWGLDRPLVLRYLHWLADFVAGDWGRSFRTGEAVFAEFRDRLPVSLLLGVSGLLVAIAIAVPLGFSAAARPGGIADRTSRALSVFVQAVPGFWLGLVLLWVLGVQLRWIRPFGTDMTAIVLPVILIASHSAAVFARVYRRDMIETTRQPYFRTALAKGLSYRQALWRHAHRGALYALLSAVRSEAGWVIGSTATMEILFNLPGISQFLVQSIAVRDQMVLQAYVMVIALWLLLMNLIVQLFQRLLDPRLA
ncbi:ABC transporter permease [Agrobacterium leguminum]|uniref:Oligopeptide transport system permease protein OppB n=1 Tax=Agrobacterium deltaense NCPPB 1641 TaxID=1183425 RepID=A0A1S7TVC2_9HYPH|nr:MULTISPECIES: ABC transporter permease [Agrobacterium]WFS68364.1 ABC transporter permease [Agrobacterium leguminum]CVI58524.1 Oligopeptide transport system permease protein OppB [Agrobacterium deltaense NCPPB 1641]